jgi:predicted DNA-binding WGR domain protein
MTAQAGLNAVDIQIALHYKQGSSDKVWAAAVAGTTYHSRWGRRGAALAVGQKDFPTPQAARKLYDSKVSEKLKEGYIQIPFDDNRYGVPSFGAGAAPAAPVTAGPPPPKFVTSHVLPLAAADVNALMADGRYGMQEKVNGRRRLIEHNAKTGLFTGYNRNGQPLPAGVPAAAQGLAACRRSFVIDGEAMEGEAVTGGYVAFDLLELDGYDLRLLPYMERLEALESFFIEQDAPYLTMSQYAGLLNSPALPPGSLVLLNCVSDYAGKVALFSQVQSAGGEGIIVRELAAPYQTGDTRYTRKFKFRADLDCEILYVKPGIATGSVGLGLTRPSDGAIIELGTARGGLTDGDMLKLQAMLGAGGRPVITVGYLPIRTVGIAPVEPTLYMRDLRTDKTAAECTTDQFEAAKQPLVAAARPWVKPA